MAGLVATFVFAAQMINFPVGAGTSGHLLGRRAGRGPGRAVDRACSASASCCSSRRLLFADGGITALGTNITLMGAGRASCVGWLVFRLLQRGAAQAARAGRRSPPAIAALRRGPGRRAGLHRCSSRSAARRRSPLGTVAHRDGRLARPDRHRRGASITGLVVGSVVAVRPDLVYGARPVLEPRDARDPRRRRPPHERRRHAPGSSLGRPAGRAARSPASVSFYASAHPDGLEYVAEQTGFVDTRRRRPPTADGPLADYRPRASTTPGSAAGSPASSASLVVLAARRRPRSGVRRRGARRATAASRRRGLTDGRRARPPAALPRALRRCTGRRRTSRSSPCSASCSSWSRRRGTGTPRSRSTSPSCWSSSSRVSRVPPRYLAQADGGRGAVRASSRC